MTLLGLPFAKEGFSLIQQGNQTAPNPVANAGASAVDQNGPAASDAGNDWHYETHGQKKDGSDNVFTCNNTDCWQ